MNIEEIFKKLVILSSKIDILLFEKHNNTKWSLKSKNIVDQLIINYSNKLYDNFSSLIKQYIHNGKCIEINILSGELIDRLKIINDIKENILIFNSLQKPKRIKKIINNDIIIESFSTNYV